MRQDLFSGALTLDSCSADLNPIAIFFEKDLFLAVWRYESYSALIVSQLPIYLSYLNLGMLIWAPSFVEDPAPGFVGSGQIVKGGIDWSASMRELRTLVLSWFAACGIITLALVPIRLYALSANDWLIGALSTLALAFFMIYFLGTLLWKSKSIHPP